MPSIYIALKDLRHALRNPFLLAFMLVLPLLQAGLPYLAFNGLEKGQNVQTTRLWVVNLDQPVAAYPDFRAGTLLIGVFQDESLKTLLELTEADSEAAARQAVETRRADVALIIPANFTASLFSADEHAMLAIHKDPALTLGPAIVQEVVVNFTDGFTGSLLAADVAAAQAEAYGSSLSADKRLEIMRRYGDWALTVGDSLAKGIHPAIRYASISPAQASQPVMKALIGPLMLGMMVFFAYFVGAIAAQSLIREAEQGTLARLLRTPASKAAILWGKFGAVVTVLALQVGLLLGLGAVIFHVSWGDVLPAAANGLGLVVSAAGFGTLLVSFLRSTRQAFLVMGGAVILTGMAGGTMTTTFANLPEFYRIINLFTPQGWVLRGFNAAMTGSNLTEALGPAFVAMMIGLAGLGVGLFNLNRRFA